jgi:RNA polymerase-interacting CarD/CdnL/TRCF family regulator
MTEFSEGDKVIHYSHGAGEVVAVRDTTVDRLFIGAIYCVEFPREYGLSYIEICFEDELRAAEEVAA